MKTDILQIHKNCLDFLLDWQAEHDDFYFVPRKINNKKRLEYNENHPNSGRSSPAGSYRHGLRAG